MIMSAAPLGLSVLEIFDASACFFLGVDLDLRADRRCGVAAVLAMVERKEQICLCTLGFVEK